MPEGKKMDDSTGLFICNSLIRGKNEELSGHKHNILICLEVQTTTVYNTINNNGSVETAILWYYYGALPTKIKKGKYPESSPKMAHGHLLVALGCIFT